MLGPSVRAAETSHQVPGQPDLSLDLFMPLWPAEFISTFQNVSLSFAQALSDQLNEEWSGDDADAAEPVTPSTGTKRPAVSRDAGAASGEPSVKKSKSSPLAKLSCDICRVVAGEAQQCQRLGH